MASLLVSCKEFLAKVMAACFVLGLILTAIFLVLFFSSPELPNVTLVSLNVSRFNFTANHISGYMNMQFQVINTNLVTDFSYDDVYCSVYHGKHRLPSTMFPRFVQRARETTPIKFTAYLTPLTTAREIRNDLAPYSFVELDVKLITFIKWRRFGSSNSVSVKVSCDDVPVGLLLATGGQGKMIGPATRTCQVF